MRKSANRQEDKQRLVGRTLRSARPHVDAVEGFQDVVARGHGENVVGFDERSLFDRIPQ